jgi:large subunit ribosomal protein L6
MSRIAKKPIVVPKNVQVSVFNDRVEVKGPKGELKTLIPAGIKCTMENGIVNVIRENDWPSRRAYQGMVYRMISNTIVGVTEGFKKELDIVGVGYKAVVQGDKLQLTLGYSHEIDYPAPAGIKIEAPQPTKIVVSGSDKQQVGQTAAEIRAFRKPDVYKGKGIRYVNEIVRKKVGKAGT